MNKLLITTLLLASSNAMAFNVSDTPKVFIDLHVTSFHAQDNWHKPEPAPWDPNKTMTTEVPFNENNSGIGIRWQIENFLDTSIGFFKNSYDNTTVYVGGEIHTPRTYFVSVGLMAAFVTGYTGNIPTPTPILALPIMQIGVPQFGIRVGYMPLGKVKFGTLSFYVGF